MPTIMDGPSFSAIIASGSVAPSTFVKFGTTSFQVQPCVGSDLPCGVSQEGQKYPPDNEEAGVTYAGTVGDLIAIYGPGRVCNLVLGSAVSVGQSLGSDSQGRGIPVTGGFGGAIATESGVTNDLIRVVVNVAGGV